jgi:anaerobic selenocysteine-containing dehydrogenase
VQRFAPAFAPPGEARPLWQILALLGRELGGAHGAVATVADAFTAMVGADVNFAGLDWDALATPAAEPIREHTHVG